MTTGAGGGVQVVVIVRMPFPADVWPSGFVTLTFLAPAVAPVVFRSKVTCVVSVYVTLFTVTPETAPARRVRHGSADMLDGVS